MSSVFAASKNHFNMRFAIKPRPHLKTFKPPITFIGFKRFKELHTFKMGRCSEVFLV